jgi:hypothetical protein
MMKWALVIAVLLTVCATTGMASVVFDFSSLGLTVQQIGSTDTGGLGYTLGNINFLYDDFGDPTTTAQISAGGVDGFAGGSGLSGLLELTFTPGFPVTGLAFGFNVSPAAIYPDGAFVTLLDSSSSTIFSNTIPTDPSGSGLFSFSESLATISQAQIFFTADPTALSFNLSPLDYDVAPEPGTFALTGSLLFLLGVGSRKLLKRRA